MNLIFTVIKNQEQYYEYCNLLEKYLHEDREENADIIDLLDVLIEDYDRKNKLLDTSNYDPVDLIKAAMANNEMRAVDLVEVLGIGKATISKILNRRIAMSKAVIRKLSMHFKISQEALNQDYKLEPSLKKSIIESISKPFVFSTEKETKREATKT